MNRRREFVGNRYPNAKRVAIRYILRGYCQFKRALWACHKQARSALRTHKFDADTLGGEARHIASCFIPARNRNRAVQNCHPSLRFGTVQDLTKGVTSSSPATFTTMSPPNLPVRMFDHGRSYLFVSCESDVWPISASTICQLFRGYAKAAELRPIDGTRTCFGTQSRFI